MSTPEHFSWTPLAEWGEEAQRGGKKKISRIIYMKHYTKGGLMDTPP